MHLKIYICFNNFSSSSSSSAQLSMILVVVSSLCYFSNLTRYFDIQFESTFHNMNCYIWRVAIMDKSAYFLRWTSLIFFFIVKKNFHIRCWTAGIKRIRHQNEHKINMLPLKFLWVIGKDKVNCRMFTGGNEYKKISRTSNGWGCVINEYYIL